MPTVELLAPAGNPEALDAALGEGADAVYLGARSFNARMRSSNFAFNQLEAALEACHKRAKKLYVTVNTVFEEREADRMWQFLQYLERLGPDGIIVQDLGVAKMARDHFAGLALHASTQMNVASAKGVNLLSRLGFKRAVLARELSLDEVRAVRASTNLELEIFVHGALCVSESGLCLFSSYLGGKSANRGTCAQACRRLYSHESGSGYWFSPDDLQLVEFVPELMEAGVDSFKIEGRMKSAEYVGTVVAAYRHMIDNWKFDREKALVKAQAMLRSDLARRKTSYFFDGGTRPDFIQAEQSGGTGIPMGKVKDIRVLDEARFALLASFDGLAEGDSLRFHRPDDSERFTAKVREVRQVPAGLLVRVDADVRQSDSAYLVQSQATSRRYKSVLPKDLSRYHKFPSREAAPEAERPSFPKSELSAAERAMPEGIYALVGRTGDLHVLNSARPRKAMLLLTRANAALMRAEEKTLPFKRDDLVLWLDPFFPEADSSWLADEIEYWIGRSQRLFVANNPGHLALLRGRGLTVVAGPYLYSFNSWAASFLLEEGARFIVPPLEISKQDFQRIEGAAPAASWMPIVFSYPALFRARADLASAYDFTSFADRDGSTYEISAAGAGAGGKSGTVVTPMRPFSITDRAPFLRKEGIDRFILDFSSVRLTKPLYKQVMRAASEGKILPETGRFNWKDGFWSAEEGPR
jgi:putative protease